MNRVGLYFGSFNPITNAHLTIAISALENNSVPLDEVWFIVSPQNPHKDKSELCDALHRITMVNLAISSIEGVDKKLFASDIEFGMPMPSYTIDTLSKLEISRNDCKFHVIVGSDTLVEIHKWKNGNVILKHYNIISYRRPGKEFNSELPKSENITTIDNAPLIEISSTDVRKRIANNKTISHLIPPLVAEYIHKNGLFI